MMDKKRWLALIIGIIVGACLILAVIIGLCVHFLSTTPRSFLSVIPPPSGGNFFWFKTEDSDDKRKWLEKYDEYLDPYISPQKHSEYLMSCPLGEPPSPKSKGVCDMDVIRWYPCVKQNNYNIHAKQKCIFLQINQEAADWIPEYYNDSLPENTPNQLRTYLIERFNQNGGRSNNVLWLNCEGETPTDKELIGPVHYIPFRGFGGQFFPNLNKYDYLQPLAAIYFENPAEGIVINVACTVWAKNLDHEEEEGVVHFEIFLDYAFSSSTLSKADLQLCLLFTICLLLPRIKRL